MIILIIILIVLFFDFQNKNLEFSVGECDSSVDAYNKSAQGIKEIEWLEDSIVQIKAYVSINCAEKIEKGNYEIKEDKIILKYKSSICKLVCAMYNCGRDLVFKIKNLERKDYEFELERV